jgi:toxin-antitoxin system PIN domain toxin
MIIPDVNLLIYAYDSTSPWHERAANWWASCLSGTTPVGMSWVVALGFVRLWTNARVFSNPMPIDLAASHVESWLNRRVVKMINPGPRHSELVFSFLRAEGKGGNLTTDAHLAALAIEFRGTIHTADTDFLRFPGVRWLNPLTEQPR